MTSKESAAMDENITKVPSVKGVATILFFCLCSGGGKGYPAHSSMAAPW